MENVDTDYEVLEKGIRQLLGKEEYPPAEVLRVCVHEPDGYIYNSDVPNARVVLLQCYKCGVQYEEIKQWP